MWPELALFAVLGSAGASTHAASLRFLALGDSYTIGESVPGPLSWPRQLGNRLRADGIDLSDPRILATTGWTTDELAAAMEDERFDPPYDLVSLSIGVNNQYRGRSVEDYRKEFVVLLRKAVELAGGRAAHVIVVSIPDWGVTRFARESGRDTAQIASELDAYNAVKRAESMRMGAGWADVSALSRARSDHADQFAADGLHPSGLQYTRWLTAILPVARQALLGDGASP